MSKEGRGTLPLFRTAEQRRKKKRIKRRLKKEYYYYEENKDKNKWARES